MVHFIGIVWPLRSGRSGFVEHIIENNNNPSLRFCSDNNLSATRSILLLLLLPWAMWRAQHCKQLYRVALLFGRLFCLTKQLIRTLFLAQIVAQPNRRARVFIFTSEWKWVCVMSSMRWTRLIVAWWPSIIIYIKHSAFKATLLHAERMDHGPFAVRPQYICAVCRAECEEKVVCLFVSIFSPHFFFFRFVLFHSLFFSPCFWCRVRVRMSLIRVNDFDFLFKFIRTAHSYAITCAFALVRHSVYQSSLASSSSSVPLICCRALVCALFAAMLYLMKMCGCGAITLASITDTHSLANVVFQFLPLGRAQIPIASPICWFGIEIIQ